jgi:hypothetical protein
MVISRFSETALPVDVGMHNVIEPSQCLCTTTLFQTIAIVRDDIEYRLTRSRHQTLDRPTHMAYWADV